MGTVLRFCDSLVFLLGAGRRRGGHITSGLGCQVTSTETLSELPPHMDEWSSRHEFCVVSSQADVNVRTFFEMWFKVDVQPFHK